jgi:hypothetical protein
VKPKQEQGNDLQENISNALMKLKHILEMNTDLKMAEESETPEFSEKNKK